MCNQILIFFYKILILSDSVAAQAFKKNIFLKIKLKGLNPNFFHGGAPAPMKVASACRGEKGVENNTT